MLKLKVNRIQAFTISGPQEEVSSDSSESLLSGSPAFATASGTLSFATGGGAGFLFALRAFASPSFSCSVGSACKHLRQGVINLYALTIFASIYRNL